MMGKALLVVGAISTLGLAATAATGYFDVPTSTHVLLATLTSLLLLFSHSWIMFYLIGTGKAIKEAVAEHALGDDLVERTKEFKNRSYPWLMLAIGLAMATFILGGGVATRVIPNWIHHVLFWLTLVAQIKTLWVEQQVLVANERLMAGINRRLQATA